MDAGLIVSRLRNRLLRLPDRIGLNGKFWSIKSAGWRANRYSVGFNRTDHPPVYRRSNDYRLHYEPSLTSHHGGHVECQALTPELFHASLRES